MLWTADCRSGSADAQEEGGREGFSLGRSGLCGESAADPNSHSSVSASELRVVCGNAAISLDVRTVSGTDGRTG